MAWVRRVRTASGATAVQIAESVDGRRRIVAHVGSAHTEVELGLLLERAREMLRSAGQGELDLDVESSPRRVRLASAATDPAVLPGTGPVTPPVVEPRVAAAKVVAAKVVATSSGLLYDVLAHLYSALGFDVVADEVFRDLVIARIVEPTSILDTGRVLTDLGRTPASERTMRRSLGRAQQGKYREQVAGACFGHAARHGDLSLCLYDVTTLYFEAEKEDPDAGGSKGLRKVGYSKERRVDPQIVVGLLVDRHGFPLEVGCFEGNRAETTTITTILPIVEAFQARHGLAGLVIVADAGMLSASNLRDLDDAGLKFIVGSRMTKAPADLESHFRWHGDAFTEGQVIDTITPQDHPSHFTRHREQPEPQGRTGLHHAVHADSWRAVWAYSTKRAVRDNKTITLQENKAKEVIAGQRTAKTPPVREDQQRRQVPRRDVPGAGPAARGPQRVRVEHRRRDTARP